MLRNSWSTHWHTVLAGAGSGLEFYERKHRAIPWMVDPVEYGGLGLDPPTVAATGRPRGRRLPDRDRLRPSSRNGAPWPERNVGWMPTRNVTSMIGPCTSSGTASTTVSGSTWAQARL